MLLDIMANLSRQNKICIKKTTLRVGSLKELRGIMLLVKKRARIYNVGYARDKVGRIIGKGLIALQPDKGKLCAPPIRISRKK
jgi:hypothetical protein